MDTWFDWTRLSVLPMGQLDALHHPNKGTLSLRSSGEIESLYAQLKVGTSDCHVIVFDVVKLADNTSGWHADSAHLLEVLKLHHPKLKATGDKAELHVSVKTPQGMIAGSIVYSVNRPVTERLPQEELATIAN